MVKGILPINQNNRTKNINNDEQFDVMMRGKSPPSQLIKHITERQKTYTSFF